MGASQLWPGKLLPESAWPAVWEAVTRHSLGLSNVSFFDWSVEEVAAFISRIGEPIIFVCLEPQPNGLRYASLVNPNQVITVIQDSFNQDAMSGLDLAVLPSDFGWCIFGNTDGEIFHATCT